MDAKAFLTAKHDAAVEELRAIDAEYAKRKESAEALVELTSKWLSELGGSRVSAEPDLNIADITKQAANSWVSSRDLNPQTRQSQH